MEQLQALVGKFPTLCFSVSLPPGEDTHQDRGASPSAIKGTDESGWV